MNRIGFFNWLSQVVGSHPANDYSTKCARIERTFSVDLDEEYEKDECNSILEQLNHKISRKNQMSRQTQDSIKEKNDLLSLAAALKTYIHFKEGKEPNKKATRSLMANEFFTI